MVYPVEKLDYKAIITEMSQAGLENMGDIVVKQVRKLGNPVWTNEVVFFWRSLYNAAREKDAVWLWLVTQPHIRQFAPAGSENFTRPQLAPEAKLPLIGGIDDTPYVERALPKLWPEDPTEENIRKQVVALEEYLRAEAEKHPSDSYKCVDDYVATFYHSGTGQMLARTQLTELGFLALATVEGIQYLRETYPPELERKTTWFVRKTIIGAVVSEFPSVSVSQHHIEVKAPENEEEFGANARLWMAVFQKLYLASEIIQALPILSFWHRLPDSPAPIGDYGKQDQFFKRHSRVARLCRVTVPEKKVEGKTIEVEVHGASLLFGGPEKLSEGVVSFCLTSEEHDRVMKPGMQGVFIMLPISHPHKLSIAAGSIHRIMLP